MPLFKYGDVIDVDNLSKNSGYTKTAIEKWFIKTFGLSVSKYLRSLQKEALKREMEVLFNSGVPIEEVAKKYGNSTTWVDKRYVEFGFKKHRVHINKSELEQILEFVSAGYVIEFIAKKFNHSNTTIQKIVNIHYKDGLVKYRHDNNIPIIHNQCSSLSEDAEIVKKCFEAGKSVKDTAKILGKTRQSVLYIKEKYNLKTNSDIAYERLEEFLPRIKEFKLKLHDVAKDIGLSAQTIRRRIKERFGKTYTEIMREK